MWRLWSVLFFVWIVVSLFFLASTVIVTRLIPGYRKIHTYLIRKWAYATFAVLNTHMEVEGREHDKPDSHSLVISNHQSLLDIPAAFVGLGGHIRMLSKIELAFVPFFGWGMACSEMLFVRRGNAKSRAKAAQMIAQRLQSGIRVWVAPEGTRSKDGSLGVFKPGSFSMAISTGADIQPIVICNAFDVLPKKSFLARPGKTFRIKVLPPVSTRGMKPEDAPALTEKVRGAMAEALTVASAL